MREHGFIKFEEVQQNIGQLQNTLISLDRFRQDKEVEIKELEAKIAGLEEKKILVLTDIKLAEAILQSKENEIAEKSKVAQLKIDSSVSELVEKEKALSNEKKVIEQQKSQMEELLSNLVRKEKHLK